MSKFSFEGDNKSIISKTSSTSSLRAIETSLKQLSSKSFENADFGSMISFMKILDDEENEILERKQ